jgi:pseudaminic acid cytidylyltransferase
VPRKNVRLFHGKPMIAYPLETAKASKLFDLIIVSTDDFEIADVAFTHNAVIVPREADDGSTGTQEIAARVLDKLQLQGSAACVMYPCSPLLDVYHLKQGYAALLNPAAKAFARSVGPDGQDAGCYYWGWMRAFRDRLPLDAFNTIDVALPAERACDVDTMDDWSRCESMYDALRRAS